MPQIADAPLNVIDARRDDGDTDEVYGDIERVLVGGCVARKHIHEFRVSNHPGWP